MSDVVVVYYEFNINSVKIVKSDNSKYYEKGVKHGKKSCEYISCYIYT